MNSISPSKRQDGLKGSVTRVVTCPICEASYAPSPTRQDLLQAPLEVVEAAFMSLCHYCFRCRRPACPQCWDAVHRVCGECVREAQLPFRAETAPLAGILFPLPASQVGHVEESGTGIDVVSLLICVRPGRLWGEMVQIVPLPPPPSISISPSTRVPLAGTLGRVDKAVLFRGAERVLNVVLGVILLSVVALMVIAELSATANAQLIGLFHVDIRSEIGYILYVIRQLRW